MTVKEFLDMSVDYQLIAIFDYSAKYDVIDNDYSDYGAFIWEGFQDDIKCAYDEYEVETILNSEIESWDYLESEKFGTRILRLNIDTEI